MTEPNTSVTFNHGQKFTPLVVQANLTTHRSNTPTLPSLTTLSGIPSTTLPHKRTYGAALTQALAESTIADTE